jgi:non-ribosomal peptide synthetase-like protein
VKAFRPAVDQSADSNLSGPRTRPKPTEFASLRPAVLRGPARPDLLREETLAEILAATARRLPEHPALVWSERVVTYGELDAASDAIGNSLLQRGAAPGLVVGLFLPRGADLLIAQAGITKSGAAWLPFDADAPLERVKICLQSASAIGLVTCREWLPRLHNFPGVSGTGVSPVSFNRTALPNSGTHGRDARATINVWAIEDLLAEKNSVSPRAAKSSDPAYVIYTSGSTGQPKGIVISQRGICHFLRAENELLGVRADDRVYQGFSVAFDMSFEEIWISYLAGATLWLAPPSLAGDPDLLAQTLTRERITVLHAVPTLMTLLNDPLLTLRLINLGGETCPAALAERLARPGRKLFNTYGPTEASVSSSLAELKSGEPITIGMPLPNYGLLVVDEQRRPLPAGEVGELCIFGPGLALGYLGRPDLTAEKFVANLLAENSSEEKMYLTGDLARIEPGGPVHCLGRADSQVKIRGFRVELDEIIAALSAQPGVAAAAVAMRKIADVDSLVAFVVPVTGSKNNPTQWRQSLAGRLPSYMVPAHFETVVALPRLTSGKIDQNALRTLPLQTVESGGAEKSQPRTEDEAALFAALAKLFPGQTFRPEADFFDDLGGHSLLAARLVSILRGDMRYAALSVQEIYRERQLAGIARAMERQRLQKPPAAVPERSTIPLRRRFFCGLAQAIVIPFFVLLNMADWLAPFFVYHYFTGDEGDSIFVAVLYSLAIFVLARFANFAIAIAGKRLAAGRLRPGRYPLWGAVYFRWWLAAKFSELPDVFLLAGTLWMPLYLRALGARIGRDVMIDTITLGAPELLTIEDGVSIGTFVNIENARVENGELVIGPVLLKKDSVVDSYSVLEENTELGERARLSGQSALSAGRKIPADEIWDGAPARRSADSHVRESPAETGNSRTKLSALRSVETLPPRPQVSFARRWLLAVLFAITAIAVSVLFFLPVFPAFMLIDWLDAHTLNVFDSSIGTLPAFGFFFLLAVPASALFLVVTMLVTGGLRWLLPRQVAGISSVHSLGYWHKRTVSMILDSSLRELHGLYASVFAPMWLRFLGVKVGRHAEISTAEGMVPELLSLGDDSFIADGALLGDEELRGGWMILKPTQIGNRSFIGNGAYVSDGAVVPDDVLIGVQTRTPKNEQLKSGQTWMGSPPMLLPAREQVKGFPESLTFRPSPLRRLGRGIVEALRIVLPLALVIATGYLVVILVMPFAEENGWGFEVANALALAGCLYGLASFLFVVALKWILVGRYRPRAAPMWTSFVWISEAVTNLYESLAVPNFLDLLRGTPMLPWALRLLGTRIGKGVYLNTTDITEFDCVRIGDEAELNALCGPQTHLFEDRVMKIGLVEIGARVTVGARTTILYDTHVGDSAQLGPLTLVAKGERLPAGTRWEGSPATTASPILERAGE